MAAVLTASLLILLIPGIAAEKIPPTVEDADLQESDGGDFLPEEKTINPIWGSNDLQEPNGGDFLAEVETVNPNLIPGEVYKEPNFWYLGNPHPQNAATDKSNTAEKEVCSLQAKINEAISRKAPADLKLTPDDVTDDRIVVPYGPALTIDYNGLYMGASFSVGVTYRDKDGNLHYHSNPTVLFTDENLDIEECCLWGDFPNFREGKYLVRRYVAGMGQLYEEFDPDTGDCLTFYAGVYVFTWAGDAEDYFSGMTD